jgi:hypothetical protein
VVVKDNSGTFHVAGFVVELSVAPASGVSFTAVDTNTVTVRSTPSSPRRDRSR